MKLNTSVAVVATLLFSVQTACAQKRASIEWVSVPGLNTGGDRVIGFDLKVSDGSIRSLPNVPPGWFLSITNDASGMTELIDTPLPPSVNLS